MLARRWREWILPVASCALLFTTPCAPRGRRGPSVGHIETPPPRKKKSFPADLGRTTLSPSPPKLKIPLDILVKRSRRRGLHGNVTSTFGNLNSYLPLIKSWLPPAFLGRKGGGGRSLEQKLLCSHTWLHCLPQAQLQKQSVEFLLVSTRGK